MREQIFWLFILSLAVASVAWTVTQEKIFEEFRDYCLRRYKKSRNIFVKKFFYVFTCEYCFSHWVTLGFLLLTDLRLIFSDLRGSVIAFFVIPWIANQWMSLYRRLRVDIKLENAIAEQEVQKTEEG